MESETRGETSGTGGRRGVRQEGRGVGHEKWKSDADGRVRHFWTWGSETIDEVVKQGEIEESDKEVKE